MLVGGAMARNAAIEGGDGDEALALASRAIGDFEGMIERLARDADRVAVLGGTAAKLLGIAD